MFEEKLHLLGNKCLSGSHPYSEKILFGFGLRVALLYLDWIFKFLVSCFICTSLYANLGVMICNYTLISSSRLMFSNLGLWDARHIGWPGLAFTIPSEVLFVGKDLFFLFLFFFFPTFYFLAETFCRVYLYTATAKNYIIFCIMLEFGRVLNWIMCSVTIKVNIIHNTFVFGLPSFP